MDAASEDGLAMRTAFLETRTGGFVVALVGMLAIGPDAALLRTQVLNGGSTAIIGCWRYILLFFANVLGATLLGGGPRELIVGAASSPKAIAGAVAIIFLINVGFTVSLLFVDAAKALLLISLNPLWAALQGTLLLGDVLHTHTIVAQAVSLVAILLVFMPVMLDAFDPDAADDDGSAAAGEDGPEKAALLDVLDLVPLATGFVVASLITYSRWQASASLEAAPAIGAAVTAVAALTKMIIVDGEPPAGLVTGLEPMFWLALLLSALGSALYDLALVIAPRSLTSAEVALILLGETLFGPLWVWLGYGDVPDSWTLLGGGLLLVALLGHEAASLTLEKSKRGHSGGGGGDGGGSANGGGSTSLSETLPYAAFGSDLQLANGSGPEATLSIPSIGAHRSPLLDRFARNSREGSKSSSRTQSLDSRTQSLDADRQAALLHVDSLESPLALGSTLGSRALSHPPPSQSASWGSKLHGVGRTSTA